MPKLTREQYIAKAKEKLRKNVEFFKQLLPEFDMTEEQIDRYVRERIDAHLIAKASPTFNEAIGGYYKKAYEYMPGRYIEGAYRRLYQDMHVDSGSNEAEEYNHMLYDGLTRDDETGKSKRKNYFYMIANAPFELDREMFKKSYYDPELARYCVNNMQLGNLCFCYSSAIFSSAYKMSDEKKFNTVKRFSEDAGSFIMNYSRIFGNEDILSVPLDMITNEQYMLVMAAATGLVSSNPKTDEEKNVNALRNT